MAENKNTVNVAIVITWPYAFYVHNVISYIADSVARTLRRLNNCIL